MINIYQKYKSLSKFTRWSIFILVFLTIFLLAFYLWSYWIFPSYNSSKPIPQDTSRISELNRLAIASNSVSDVDSQKDFNKDIEESLSKNKYTDFEKAQLYLYQASAAYNINNYQEAYDYALKSEQLSPTASSAELLGNCLAKLDKKQEAIDYYNKAISRITDTDELSEADRDYLRFKIQQLQT